MVRAEVIQMVGGGVSLDLVSLSKSQEYIFIGVWLCLTHQPIRTFFYLLLDNKHKTKWRPGWHVVRTEVINMWAGGITVKERHEYIFYQGVALSHTHTRRTPCCMFLDTLSSRRPCHWEPCQCVMQSLSMETPCHTLLKLFEFSPLDSQGDNKPRDNVLFIL